MRERENNITESSGIVHIMPMIWSISHIYILGKVAETII